MSYFYFNGFYSYEMGLIVEEKSIYNGPQPDFELISVPGRNGDVILDHGRYKNVEVSYTVSFIGTKEKAAALRQWLCARAVYGYLFDSEQPDHFRYAVFVSQLDIEEVMHNVGRAVFTFSCKPYLYRKDGAMAEKYTQSGFVLTNPEQYRSVPDITVYGTGNIYLNIGYNQYYMEDIRSQIILDGELILNKSLYCLIFLNANNCRMLIVIKILISILSIPFMLMLEQVCRKSFPCKYASDISFIAITKELADTLRKNRTIDWQKRDSARAKMRMMIKKLLNKHHYPPEGMEDAVQTVMTQCELWTDNAELG